MILDILIAFYILGCFIAFGATIMDVKKTDKVSFHIFISLVCALFSWLIIGAILSDSLNTLIKIKKRLKIRDSL